MVIISQESLQPSRKGWGTVSDTLVHREGALTDDSRMVKMVAVNIIEQRTSISIELCEKKLMSHKEAAKAHSSHTSNQPHLKTTKKNSEDIDQ